jgi:hypothetical protein
MKYFFLTFLISLSASAFVQDDNDITHRPKAFAYQNDKAVFVDFEEVTYYLNYDVGAKATSVKAIFKMHVVEEGYPIFDLVQEPTSVKLDGESVTAPTVATPSHETSVRVIGKKLAIGQYTLEVTAPIKDLVEFTSTGVKSAFWVNDLRDRTYLERYIPCNLEYDRIKKTFDLSFVGLKNKQQIFANGVVTWVDESHAKIKYPEYFTVDSVYFHTTPVGSMDVLEFKFKSRDGRDIPVAVYTAKKSGTQNILQNFKTKVTSVLNELEADYGPFLHPSVTIYNADLSAWGLGGMEYSGATVTNIGSVSHELFHSYFARGIRPANGNAGWIDESLATWRDNRYPRMTTLSGSTQMAANSYYTRKTDRSAYSFGGRFMAYLDGKFAAKGGLKPFLNKLLEHRLFSPIFTEDFIEEMETFYGEKIASEFKKFVYGSQKDVTPETHIHRKMTPEQMKHIL